MLHVLQDANEGKPLCGRGRVRFVGEVGQPMGDGWPWCEDCVRIAGPDMMDGWL